MRHVNRLLGALVSVALVSVAALVIIEVIAFRFTTHGAIVHWRSPYSWAGRTTWKQGSVRVTCITLIVVGLVLLLAELRRSKVSRLAAEPATGVDGVDSGYTRRGVVTAVRAAVLDVDGVRAAKVAVKRRKVTVSATSSARDKTAAQSMTDPIAAAAQARIDALGLRAQPSVSVRVEPRSS